MVGDTVCNDLTKEMKDKTCNLVNANFKSGSHLSLPHPADVLQMFSRHAFDQEVCFVLFCCIMPEMAHLFMKHAVFYGQFLVVGPSRSLEKLGFRV